MKRISKAIAGTIALSAAIFATEANAAATSSACEQSCTQVAAICVKMGASSAACHADMANCLKTGNLHMPSGKTFTNLCKK